MKKYLIFILILTCFACATKLNKFETDTYYTLTSVNESYNAILHESNDAYNKNKITVEVKNDIVKSANNLFESYHMALDSYGAYIKARENGRNYLNAKRITESALTRMNLHYNKLLELYNKHIKEK